MKKELIKLTPYIIFGGVAGWNKIGVGVAIILGICMYASEFLGAHYAKNP